MRWSKAILGMVLLVLVALAANFLRPAFFPLRYDTSQSAPEWVTAKVDYRSMELNGYTVEYDIQGDGLPVVFVPGLGGHARELQAYPILRSKYKCVTYYLRGQAGDGNQLRDYDIKVLADDLNDFMVRLDISKAVLFGSSYGGTIALQFTLDHPEKVKALIINSSFARFDWDFKQRAKLAFLDNAPDFAYSTLMKIHAYDEFDKEDPQWAYEYFLERDLATPKESFLKRGKTLRTFDVRHRLSEITVPTLITYGELDRLTGNKYQVYLNARINNSYIKVIEGTAHHVTIVKVPELDEAISGFLAMVGL